MNKRDLIVLVADRDMEGALKALLSRHQSLGIQAIDYDIIVHSGHDAVCAQQGVKFLSNFTNQYRYALLMFDHEGSGRENVTPEQLGNSLNAEFANSAWGQSARAIILVPELEAWIWSDSPHVEDVMGWKNRQPTLREWLIQRGLLQDGQVKPEKPKETFRAALREASTPRSSSLYFQLAGRVSFNRCRDKAFLQLKEVLSEWFSDGIEYDE